MRNKQKIFCIGAGKTGTTSVESALNDFGYKLGDQSKGELLIDAYAKRDFAQIIKFCKSAEAFQDAPFSFKYTFMALDIAYPDSKFILTIRDSPDQWYQSMTNFHSKIHTKTGKLPTIEDLKQSEYRYKGYAWDVRHKVFGIQETDQPYDKDLLVKYYTEHNQMVLDYFRFKENLLVINLSDNQSYNKLCSFLEKGPLYKEFPWKNKTTETRPFANKV